MTPVGALLPCDAPLLLRLAALVCCVIAGAAFARVERQRVPSTR